MDKFRGVPMVLLRSLANSTGTICGARKPLQLSARSSTINWLTPRSGKLQIRCHSSYTGAPVHGSQGSPISLSGELDKVAADDCNKHTVLNVADQSTSPKFTSACHTRNQMRLSIPSSAIKWLTPISKKLLTRCFSSERMGPVAASQGLSVAISDAVEKVTMDESNQSTVLNDFNWHAHIAVGSFLYKGQLITIRRTSLQEYSVKNPMLEMRQIYGDPNGKCKSFVKDDAKGHTWQLINSLSEFHRIGLCIEDLDDSKILMCDGVAKFSPDISFVAATDELIEENYLKLEKAVRGTLFQGKPLPYQMNHLLKIMRTEAIKSVALMKCHIALVRQVHKTAVFMRMYDLVDALRLSDYQLWLKLLSFLPYKSTWLKIMLKNKLIYASLMRKREGDLSDPAAALAYLMRMLKAKKYDQAKFVHKYRSLSTHKLDDSVDPVTGEILYKEQMFEDILESELPKLTADLQYGLHKLGKLELAQLDSFFALTVPVGTFNMVKDLLLPKE